MCVVRIRGGLLARSRIANRPAGDEVSGDVGLAPPGSRAQPAVGRAAFASLPDTGDLIAYPSRLIRRDGAYTWHRAALSEQHALRAIVDGHLSVTAPGGERLDFAYARHVEHLSGDWTWIGKLAGAAEGEEAILTFGEKAAFGTIAQPGKEPLRLTVRNGASWLVETDRAALALINNGVTRPRKPDYFIPPKLAIGHETGASTASQEGEGRRPPGPMRLRLTQWTSCWATPPASPLAWAGSRKRLPVSIFWWP